MLKRELAKRKIVGKRGQSRKEFRIESESARFFPSAAAGEEEKTAEAEAVERRVEEEIALAEDIATADFESFITTPLELEPAGIETNIEEALGIRVAPTAAAGAGEEREERFYIGRRGRGGGEEETETVEYAGRREGTEYAGRARADYAEAEPMYGTSYEASRYQTVSEGRESMPARTASASSELERFFHPAEEMQEEGRLFMPEVVEQKREFGVREMLGLGLAEKYESGKRRRRK